MSVVHLRGARSLMARFTAISGDARVVRGRRRIMMRTDAYDVSAMMYDHNVRQRRLSGSSR